MGIAGGASESELAELWRSGWLRGRELRDSNGNALRVLHPGLGTQGGGPDFRDAVIAWRTGESEHLCQGDVELHTHSTLWSRHGHQSDARFNTVMLHVVLRHESGTETVLENGDRVPILPLLQLQEVESPGRGVPPPCRVVSPRGMAAAAEILMEMGEVRFFHRARRMETDIAAMGPAQALYYWTMDALGYSRNRAACRELAQRVPLGMLERHASSAAREAVLFGHAGLLPSQRPGRPRYEELDPWVAALESHWRREGVAGRMDFSQWEFICVRPANSPARRVAAMAALAGKWANGLLPGMLDEISGRPSLWEALYLGGQGYWGEHYDFGRKLGGTGNGVTALIGRNRAMDICANVSLPFAFACSGVQRDSRLREAAIRLYRSHPSLGMNRIMRHVSAQVWEAPSPRELSACQQLGMVHIFHTSCSMGACGGCPLGAVPSCLGDRRRHVVRT